MKSLIIPMTTLPLFMKARLSIPVSGIGIVHKIGEMNPVENEELFDHLFVHDDRRFSRLYNQFFTASYSGTNF
jgi:hypothetical protein